MSKINNCPICNKEVDFNTSNKYRPFCSKRCRLIDLGQWINESYTISENSTNNFENNSTISSEEIKH